MILAPYTGIDWWVADDPAGWGARYVYGKSFVCGDDVHEEDGGCLSFLVSCREHHPQGFRSITIHPDSLDRGI